MANCYTFGSALCYGLRMGTGIDQKKRLERWRRNKREERARKPKPSPAVLSPEFVAAVSAEADRREDDAGRWGGWRRELSRPEQKIIASVWAAKTILEMQSGKGMATPTRITKWLAENDRMHSYTAGSLRVLTYKALRRIEALETTIDRDTSKPIWPAFT